MQAVKKYLSVMVDDLKDVSTIDTLCALLIIAFPILLVLGRAPADIALSLCGILFLSSSAIRYDFSWMKQKWFIFGVLFWLYVICASFIAIDIQSSIGQALPWVRFIIFAACMQYIFQQYPNLLKYLIGSVIVTLSFVMFDALNQYITGSGIWGHQKNGVRLTAPFDNMVVGIFLSALSPLVIALSFYTIVQKDLSVKIKLLASGFVLLTLVTIFLSGERMALGLCLLSIMAIMLYYLRNIKYIIVLFLALCCMLGVLFFSFNDLFERHIDQTFTQISEGKESSYYMLFESGMRVFFDNPLFGVGLKNYRLLSEEYMSGTKEMAKLVANLHPHNYYIEMLCETGLMGMILMILLFFYWARVLIKLKPFSQNPFILGGFIGVLVKLWPLSTSGSFFSNWNASIFWFLFGVSLVMLPIQRNNKMST